jgi:DNA mismatch repair protein MutL
VPIRVLPESVASAIAAGEVVERPESVVKELVENSIDAGATRIQISIEAGGKKLIKVVDDGAGIRSEEMVLSVARHATSKLATKDDLFKITTLGFRGEALSSIAAVAHLEIVTRAQTEEIGTKLNVSGAAIKDQKPVGTPIGTTVRVQDLFFNVPARLKFLKTETTERRRIGKLVSRYALAYPNISFQLNLEGRTKFNTSGNGDRREVLASAQGLDIAKDMIAIPKTEGSGITVSGFISSPTVHRGSRREITFFVQGRWVQDSSLSAAVVQAYHGMLMVGRYPMAVLFLEIAPELVDVNVHPAKAEVRFQDPGAVFTVVQRVIRGTLIGQAPSPELEIESTWRSFDRSSPIDTVDPHWEIAHPEGLTLPEIPPQRPIRTMEVPLLRSIGQVGTAYLVAEGPDGLYLIDQHAAHERVLFEAMMRAWGDGVIESQTLLEPLSISLDHSEAEFVESQLETLQSLGFDIELFGRETFRIRSVPALVSNIDPSTSFRSVVDELEEDERPLEGVIEARIAARVCKSAAIKTGQVLSLEEQRKLIRDLEACESPRTCPHGRPTMIHLSVESLERQFGRRG